MPVFRHAPPLGGDGLRIDDCKLPETGWGRLDLADTRPAVGKDWTDSGQVHEYRGLKNRPRRATRQVPIPPELVIDLRAHIAKYGVAPDGRLSEAKPGSAAPIVLQLGLAPRTPGCTHAVASGFPLARRPYDLRHGVSVRLNAGVPATQVAEWAGHNVEVLLTIYAKCIDGRDQVWFEHLNRALGEG